MYHTYLNSKLGSFIFHCFIIKSEIEVVSGITALFCEIPVKRKVGSHSSESKIPKFELFWAMDTKRTLRKLLTLNKSFWDNTNSLNRPQTFHLDDFSSQLIFLFRFLNFGTFFWKVLFRKWNSSSPFVNPSKSLFSGKWLRDKLQTMSV